MTFKCNRCGNFCGKSPAMVVQRPEYVVAKLFCRECADEIDEEFGRHDANEDWNYNYQKVKQ